MTLLLVTAGIAHAHDAPEDHIHSLNHRIAKAAPSAELLIRRAEARMAIAAYEEACEDYRASLAIDTDQPIAYHGLCQALLRQKKYEEAIKAASAGLDRQPPEQLVTTLHALRADAHGWLGDHEQAVLDWRVATGASNPMSDWVLKHARSLSELGRPAEACKVLRAAIEERPNASLEKASARALIAADRLQEAKALVDSALRRSRVKANWLVIEGELLMALGETSLARDSAELALAEIDELRLRAPENTHLLRQLSEASDLLRAAGLATTD